MRPMRTHSPGLSNLTLPGTCEAILICCHHVRVLHHSAAKDLHEPLYLSKERQACLQRTGNAESQQRARTLCVLGSRTNAGGSGTGSWRFSGLVCSGSESDIILGKGAQVKTRSCAQACCVPAALAMFYLATPDHGLRLIGLICQVVLGQS